MEQTIRLTEQELHNLIYEIINSMNEGKVRNNNPLFYKNNGYVLKRGESAEQNDLQEPHHTPLSRNRYEGWNTDLADALSKHNDRAYRANKHVDVLENKQPNQYKYKHVEMEPPSEADFDRRYFNAMLSNIDESITRAIRKVLS